MAYGLEKFKEKFQGYEDCYVIIGGMACKVLFNSFDLDFRSTKDLDVVIIICSKTSEFIKLFLEFINDGKYEAWVSKDNTKQYYRYINYDNKEYPKMIEIFCKDLDYNLINDNNLTPLYFDESIYSLSAIMLDKYYYELLVRGRCVVNEISILGLKVIILFKIKAFLDLTDRKNNGYSIDSKTILKHRNDVFKLFSLMKPNDKLIVVKSIQEDVYTFCNIIKKQDINLSLYNFNQLTIRELIEIIKNTYVLIS